MLHLRKNTKTQIIFLGVVLVGLFHVLIYALVMPPWGVIDESQHFHYVQVIAIEHRLPVMWQDKLSEDVVNSMIVSKRYNTLFGTKIPTRETAVLDYESYEAYQPPLYYLFLSLFYLIAPNDILSKLFILRIVGVVLSTVTLIIVWYSSNQLFHKNLWIATVATLFVALIPERAVSIAQLNNDILLEVTCSVLFLLLSLAVKKGFNWRRTFLMGVAMGLAAITKMSALIIVGVLIFAWGTLSLRQHRQLQTSIKQMFTLGFLASVFVTPVFFRNIYLYRDITGIGAFSSHVGDLVKGTWSHRLLLGITDVFRNSWVILWDGIQVTEKPSATVLLGILLLITILIIIALFTAWLRRDRLLVQDIMVVGLLTILLIGVSVVIGYIRGFLPMVQGRFLLPVTVPSAWFVGLGLWLLGKYWRNFVANSFLAIEFLLSMSVLFFHTLPKYYIPKTKGFLGYWLQTQYLFSANGIFWDKPDFITPGVVIIAVLGCMLSGVLVIVWGIKVCGFPIRWEQLSNVKYILRQKWHNIQPCMYETKYENKQERSLASILTDPLLWIGGSLFLIYLAWVSLYPPNVFWSLDEGGKFIHLKSIIVTKNLFTSLNYPGGVLDTALEFVPLNYWSRISNQIYSWWSISLPLVTIPFYTVFGWIGLYILPAGFGALTAVLSGVIVRQLETRKRNLSVIATLITGLATPVFFYSTTYWEHTINSGLFLGGVLAVLYAWRWQKVSILWLAGFLFSIATYFRSETSLLVIGILGSFILIRWRWVVILGIGYLVSSIPWGIFNILLTDDFLGRRDVTNALNAGSSWFPGLKEAGLLFFPYTLFNAPKIGAFAIPNNFLLLATVSVVVVVLGPIFSKKSILLFLGYSVVAIISIWVLVQPQGYHSVHGVLLIAPHLIFATMIFLNKNNFCKTPLLFMLIGMIFIYAGVYMLKGWVAAGGLQWGPRYFIIFYPLLTIVAIIGLVNSDYRLFTRNAFLVLFSVTIFVGVGFQIRGLISALHTRQYYGHTEKALDNLPTDMIVTDCSWLSMVMPEIYFDKRILVVKDTNDSKWKNFLSSHHISNFYYVKMDLCTAANTLDKIKQSRESNPSGLIIQRFSVSQ